MRLEKINIEPIVRQALIEDIGPFGDRTSQAVLAPDSQACGRFVARADGILCGIEVARLSFHLINDALEWHSDKQDGDSIRAGEPFALVKGAALDILSAERVALNFLVHLCGIASATAKMVALADKTKICCTRKTSPNLRLLEKYAVMCGGGYNHRFGLSDGILIKDNHLALTPSISEAVRRARARAAHLTKIEVEADSLAMLEEIIASGADAVLLDNMSAATLSEAVALIGGRVITEASGNIALDNVAAVAASGVDIISSGWLTHSASGLDIGLDVEGL